MHSQDVAVQTQSAPLRNTAETDDPHLPLELLELELSLEGFEGGEQAFREAVRKAAVAAGGEFLFDLPAAGLVADCLRLAVIRIPAEADTTRVVLAMLHEDDSEIRLQEPDDETAHLVRFADAFVDVLERMPEPAHELA